MISAAASTGVASSCRIAVMNCAQVVSGMRKSERPGARIVRITSEVLTAIASRDRVKTRSLMAELFEPVAGVGRGSG